LRYRDYRLLWISLIVSSIGAWMQIIAQSLLVLQITHGSSIALGFVALAQASSFFFLFALIVGSYSLYLLIGRLFLILHLGHQLTLMMILKT
jgi:fatty acid desaturase